MKKRESYDLWFFYPYPWPQFDDIAWAVEHRPDKDKGTPLHWWQPEWFVVGRAKDGRLTMERSYREGIDARRHLKRIEKARPDVRYLAYEWSGWRSWPDNYEPEPIDMAEFERCRSAETPYHPMVF